MNLIKKINRGLVLFIILLAILIIYLIALQITRTAEKPAIKDLCSQAISLLDERIVIPEELRLNSETYSKEAFQQYIDESCNKYQEFCGKDNTVSGSISYIIRMQNENGMYYNKYNNSSISNIEYTFYGDTVSIYCITNVSYTNTMNEMLQTKEINTHEESASYSFIFRKENDTWKLIAFDPLLNFYHYNSSNDIYYNSSYGGIY